MGNKGKIMTQQHIDNDMLDEFVKTMLRVENATADTGNMNGVSYNDILDHLADCKVCRDQVSIISRLQNDWPQLHFQSSLTDDQQQMICDYIDGLLQVENAEKIKTLINDDPEAMKAALHYQGHVTSMQAELSREGRTLRQDNVAELAHVIPGSKNTKFTDLLASVSQFFSIRIPMVYAMTATAAIFIVALLLIQFQELQSNQINIAAYQDNPTIQFTAKNKLPGVGFFAQSGNISKPFKDIRIELISANTIKISWPEVDGTALYKMRIQVFNQGRKTVLKEKSTQNNYTTFQLESEPQTFNANKRYEWVLYGNTTDDRMFYASGGFVISKADADSW